MTGPQDIGGEPPRIYRDIDAAMRRGDLDKAIALARQGLGDGLVHPVLLNLRAYWHETAGRHDAACVDLERALLLSPGDARLLNELGRCRTGAGRFAEAVEACQAAHAAEPGFAAAHYNEAFACEQLGELDAAWDAYSRAAELDPAMDDAVARLAGLAARRGEHAKARALADRVLAVQPGHAIAAFAHITADLAEGKFADAERRARAVAADPATIPQARIHAESFLADALDGEKRWPEAFALYTRANSDLKDLFRHRFEGAGKETGRPLARRLAAEFATLPREAWHAPSDPGDADVAFLMGFPRSGTTLLGQILAAHPRVVTIEEKPLLGAAIIDFIQKPGGLKRLAGLPPSEVARYRALFWRAVRNEGVDPTGRIVVDQTPLNTLHLPVIAKLFPGARVVFALRDPRDVVLSCFRRLFALNEYVYEFLTLEGSARFYDETMRLAEPFRDGLGLRFLDLRNEDVIADFDGRTQALCAFLGLDWDAAMRDFAQAATQRRIATASALQVTRGLRKDGIGHWRAYADALAPAMPIVATWLERFGYA